MEKKNPKNIPDEYNQDTADMHDFFIRWAENIKATAEGSMHHLREITCQMAFYAGAIVSTECKNAPYDSKDLYNKILVWAKEFEELHAEDESAPIYDFIAQRLHCYFGYPGPTGNEAVSE